MPECQTYAAGRGKFAMLQPSSTLLERVESALLDLL